MTGPSRAEQETARLAAEVARRAARRLDVFEWVVFAAAVVVAILGGYGVAWLLTGPGAANFRTIWVVAALLLFVVPGAIVIYQNRKADRLRAAGREAHPEEDDG